MDDYTTDVVFDKQYGVGVAYTIYDIVTLWLPVCRMPNEEDEYDEEYPPSLSDILFVDLSTNLFDIVDHTSTLKNTSTKEILRAFLDLLPYLKIELTPGSDLELDAQMFLEDTICELAREIYKREEEVNSFPRREMEAYLRLLSSAKDGVFITETEGDDYELLIKFFNEEDEEENTKNLIKEKKTISHSRNRRARNMSRRR